MAQITTQDIFDTVSREMAKANSILLETAPDRFNRNVLNLLQEEIRIGKEMALRDRHKNPDDRIYVYYGQFPLAVFEGMTPDFLEELKKRDITLYLKGNPTTANIRIVYRF